MCMRSWTVNQMGAMGMQVGVLRPLLLVGDDGQPVAVVGGRLLAFLIRLALEPDRRMSASSARIDAVWTEKASEVIGET